VTTAPLLSERSLFALQPVSMARRLRELESQSCSLSAIIQLPHRTPVNYTVHNADVLRAL
jgi:hypothetical protein